MVAVGAQDAVGLAPHPVVDRLAVAEARGLVGPRAGFDLVVEAEAIRRLERRLRRAPGVEADVVQAVRLRDADDPLPGRHVGRRMPGLRERCSTPACRGGRSSGR